MAFTSADDNKYNQPTHATAKGLVIIIIKVRSGVVQGRKLLMTGTSKVESMKFLDFVLGMWHVRKAKIHFRGVEVAFERVLGRAIDNEGAPTRGIMSARGYVYGNVTSCCRWLFSGRSTHW